MSRFLKVCNFACASTFFIACLTIGSAYSQNTHNHSTDDIAVKHGTATAGNIAITSAWTRQTPPNAKVAGGYLTLTNNGDTSDTLIGGAVNFAKRVEIHEMAVTDGVMRMKPVDGGLTIEPGKSIELKPGGFHIMFMGVSKTPVQGETVPVTLTFEKAGDVMVLMPVAAIGATSLDGKTNMGADHSKMGHSGHGMKKEDH